MLTSEAEFNDALKLVPLLASTYLLPSTATAEALGIKSINVKAALTTITSIRALAVKHLLSSATTSTDSFSTGLPMQAALPLLARAIFWIYVPQQADKAQPVLNRRFALAYACALARLCVPPNNGGN